MPTKKPRITVTFDQRAHEVLARLSAASGDSMSEIVAGFVEVALPSLERVVVVLERAKAVPEEARAGFAAAMQRGEQDLISAAQAAFGQLDLFLSGVSGFLSGPVEAEGRGSTPVPVTRGSGRSRKPAKGVQGGAV